MDTQTIIAIAIISLCGAFLALRCILRLRALISPGKEARLCDGCLAARAAQAGRKDASPDRCEPGGPAPTAGAPPADILG